MIDLVKNNFKIVINNEMTHEARKLFRDVLWQMVYMKVIYNNVMDDDFELDKIDRVFEYKINDNCMHDCKLAILDAVVKKNQIATFCKNFHDKHQNISLSPRLDLVLPKLKIERTDGYDGSKHSRTVIYCDDSKMKDSDGNVTSFENLDLHTFDNECYKITSVLVIDEDPSYIDELNLTNIDVIQTCHEFGYYKNQYLKQYPLMVDEFIKNVNDFVVSNKL